MSNSNELSNMLEKGKDLIEKETKPLLREGKKQMKESGKDWWNYVETHPLQTLLFGVIGYFALKGLCKE